MLLAREDASLEVVGDDVLTILGEADFDSAGPLAQAGRHWLEQQPAEATVSFDLTGVQVASSAVLSVLLVWVRSVQRHSLVLERVLLSPPLQRLMTITELAPLLPARETTCSTSCDTTS
ncbi:STAS domain-containing protein [Salinicola avicenniae]|uniref:STAS domain-containing protein n=1 Tax=Salinicola avicenniae TaxID=2916836 RepID=UPI002074013F|nr:MULTISPECIES: STAS domain-containing protein [unclassified Salinicola]